MNPHYSILNKPNPFFENLTSYHPCSQSAFSISISSTTNRLEKAEMYWLQTKDLSQIVALLQQCLYELGKLYCHADRLEAAEESWLHAKALFEAFDSQSSNFPECVFNLGIYSTTNRLEAAVEYSLQAKDLFQALSPQSLFPLCLYHLGLLYDQ